MTCLRSPISICQGRSGNNLGLSTSGTSETLLRVWSADMQAGLFVIRNNTIDDAELERLGIKYIASAARWRDHHRVECLGTHAHVLEVG